MKALRIWRAGLIAGALSLLANIILGVLGVALFDVPAEFGPLQWNAIASWSIIGAVGATAVFHVVAWAAKDPARVFQLIAYPVLVLSLIPDLLLLRTPHMFAGTTVGGVVTLMAMHLAEGLLLIQFLKRAAPQPTSAGSRASELNAVQTA